MTLVYKYNCHCVLVIVIVNIQSNTNWPLGSFKTAEHHWQLASVQMNERMCSHQRKVKEYKANTSKPLKVTLKIGNDFLWIFFGVFAKSFVSICVCSFVCLSFGVWLQCLCLYLTSKSHWLSWLYISLRNEQHQHSAISKMLFLLDSDSF